MFSWLFQFDTAYTALGVTVLLAPLSLLILLGGASLLHRPWGERATRLATRSTVLLGLGCGTAILILMLAGGDRHVPIVVGDWVSLEQEHFHFTLKFVFDRLSTPFVILTFVLCGAVGAFANVYLHRESGFNRFFVCFALFLLGMIVASLAGTIETLFVGWELVGLSSALLVAYFHEREAPVRGGLHTWLVYRVSDAALLIAALTLHHLVGEGEFDKLMGAGDWPYGRAALTENQALFVGMLVLVAVAGKSALVPFSGWLPRAMEGPTPSSAVFYGALSVHLGAFLLLRLSPILALSPWLRVAVVTLGLLTAAHAALSLRAQTDIKTALAYASLIQVGLIVVEIGLGWQYVALAHVLGHGCLRTLQLLRAPSVLRDHQALENALGARLSPPGAAAAAWLPPGARLAIHRFAFERAYLDPLLWEYCVFPVLRVFQWCDAAERWWTDLLSGQPARKHDAAPPDSEPGRDAAA